MIPGLNRHAARVCLSLAAILMTHCQAQPVLTVTPLPVVEVHPTLTPLPLTATLTPTFTPIPTSTSTFTPTPSPSPTLTASPPPTSLPATPLPPRATSPLKSYTTTITLPTYPFKAYWQEQLDPVYNLTVMAFNRAEYEAASPSPIPVTYQAVVLENPFLRLTFLPELGGRLYSAIIKATGQELFYHNAVVKPSVYGPLPSVNGLNPNSWLAVGGMEWAYPVQEHGYRWGVPWAYEVQQTADQATIVLSDWGEQRVGAQVSVTLKAEAAQFMVQPYLVNHTAAPVPIQFWVNAALTLGAPTMSPQTQFILPTEQVIVHSRGEGGWVLPEAQAAMPWPQVGEHNLQFYNQWANYLGIFAPELTAPFMGAYNPDTQLAVVRLRGTAQGNKLFAFSPYFSDRSYTDDASQYFELWGSRNKGFWAEQDIQVAPGEALTWQETWWPLAQTQGLSWATEAIALKVSPQGTAYQITAQVSSPLTGTLIAFNNNIPFQTELFTATPQAALTWVISPLSHPLRLEFRDAAEQILLNYVVKE